MGLSSLRLNQQEKENSRPERSKEIKDNKKTHVIKRQNVSSDEIRAKLEAHRNKNSKNDPAFKVEVTGKKRIAPVLEGEEVLSDVSFNDPKDPATIGKLKSILQKGSFGFSEKEKNVLAKILNEN